MIREGRGGRGWRATGARAMLLTLPLLLGIAGAARASEGAGADAQWGAAPWARDLLAGAPRGGLDLDWASEPARADGGLLLSAADVAAALTDPADSLGAPQDLESAAGLGAAPRRWWPVVASAVIPGLGEVITGHPRGVLFIAVDAASWYQVKHFSDQGNDKEDEFEAFADAHWDSTEWKAALASGAANDDFGYPAGTTPDQVPLWVPYSQDPREYYENLGKWDVFWYGWDDGYPAGRFADEFDPKYMTDNRKHYVDLRGQSNDAFSNRDKFLTLNVVTRVLSVIDVAYLEGFIGGRYKDRPAKATGPGAAGALADARANALPPQVSLLLEPHGLTETQIGLKVTY